MRPKWVDRRFETGHPAALFPLLLERLRGTPARLEEKLRDVPPELRVRRDGEEWSMQEHAGHLHDLEGLHLGRLDDFDAGAAVLRPADMTNRRTWEASHNARPTAEVLAAFRAGRERFVRRIEGWDEAALERRALHPRLQVSMGPVDLVAFIADHDDHHLTRMTEIRRRLAADRLETGPPR